VSLNRERRSEIQIGKGRIVIDEGLRIESSGKFIVMQLASQLGPCRDDSCQIRTDVEVSLLDNPPPSCGLIFRAGDTSIAMPEQVYRALDRGRETITIERGKMGSIRVKGFILTS
jgi:hypothetical protein